MNKPSQFPHVTRTPATEIPALPRNGIYYIAATATWAVLESERVLIQQAPRK
jgi:hypothetical protein